MAIGAEVVLRVLVTDCMDRGAEQTEVAGEAKGVKPGLDVKDIVSTFFARYRIVA